MMNISHRLQIAAESRVLVSLDEFQIPEHRLTILLGESGIGKSLIAKTLYGLLDPTEFTITLDGRPYEEYLRREETRSLKANGFFVFQEPSSHLNPLITLGEQIREGSLGEAPNEAGILRQLWENSSPGETSRLLEVFPKPHRPSGGEKQRMLLAMAFKKIDLLPVRSDSPPPALFVFDEPTGSLDNHYRDLFLHMLIERFRRVNFTALLITHDYSMIGRIHECYKDLMGCMSFKELKLQHDRVTQHDFDPEQYLQWLSGQRPTEAVKEEDSNSPPLLIVESRIDVFGRRLTIRRDDGATTPHPLILRKGSMVYLKAPSGIGKTTLVKLVMGLYKPEFFRARFRGVEMTEKTPRAFWQKEIWGKKMTLVFQHADEALNPESTVKGTFSGLPNRSRTDDEHITAWLAEVFDDNVDASFLTKKVKYLSGGQKQRLNLLRALSLDTDVLILDEPLNGLDFESAGKVVRMVQTKQEAGKGILLISHNEEIFDRLVRKQDVYYLTAERLAVDR